MPRPLPLLHLLALLALIALLACETESPAEADGAADAALDGSAIECIVDADCDAGEICDAGRCVPPPACDCPAIVAPVCGVDGITYDNACRAGCAGVVVDAEGACPEPCECDALADPVCGADGVTYDNPCLAGCAGVAIDRPGRCEDQPCGSRGLEACAAEAYCDFAEGCGEDDGGGQCRPRPDACPEVIEPVCGCDGVSYGNACEANAAGVDVAAEGMCDTGCDCPALIEPVCGVDGVTYDNACLAACAMVEVDHPNPCPAVCGGMADDTCADDAWCDYDGPCRAPDAQGICRPRPDGCDDVLLPVCGCDDQTYPNRCEAERAGVDVQREGECEVAGCTPDECGPQPGLPNYRCEDGSVGGPTGRCLRGEDDQCGWEIRDCPDAPEPVACGARLGDTCAPDHFCDFDRLGCDFADATGTCRPRPDGCGGAFQPVCGCDGQTYDSPCLAHVARTDVAAEGPCDGGGGEDECPAEECGPQPGLPNVQCDDGSVGGPTGRCLRGADNRCGWEIRACPGDP